MAGSAFTAATGRKHKGRLRAGGLCGVSLLAFFFLLSCVFERLQLLRAYYTKRPSQIIVRTGGEEELVGPAVVCRSSTEFNPPQLVDDDVLAVRVPDHAQKLPTKET